MSKKYKNKLEMQEIIEANKRLKCYQRMKIKPKAFAIPILTVVNTMQSEQGQQMLQDLFSFSNNT